MDEPDWTRCPVLRLSGDVDVATAPDVRVRVSEAIKMSTQHALVLDLAGVTFLDSSGIHALIAVLRDGAQVQLRDAPDNVARVIRLSGIDTIPGLFIDPA